jgi:hypothetical protein
MAHLFGQTIADVKFIVQGTEIGAQTAILSAISPVVAAMLKPAKFCRGQALENRMRYLSIILFFTIGGICWIRVV